MCESCGNVHGRSSRWLKLRAAGVIGSGVIAAAVLIADPGSRVPGPSSTTSATTDRVFVSDSRRQQASGRALAAAGMQSAVPQVRRMAEELSRLERNHPGDRVAPVGSRGRQTVVAGERRFVAAVRDHLEADVLIARIERSDGADRALRRRAASMISGAQLALVALPGDFSGSSRPDVDRATEAALR